MILKNISTIIPKCLIALSIAALASCSADMDGLGEESGRLTLAIGHVSQQTQTKAAPSVLGKPVAEKFNLRIQRSGSSSCQYDGVFVESITLSTGTYSIVASCGDNPIIGRDTPYYEGDTEVTIQANEDAQAIIPCRVANALVSARFGTDDDEKARFDRFYSEYGIRVKIGDYVMDIMGDDAGRSIYFRAGSSPRLYFFGKLKEDNDRLVELELSSEALPQVFAAADHAIVTLSLPDPESAVNVNISKIEMEEATLEETIPLSWLPIPEARVTHSYNKAGALQGTDITFSNSYPSMTWKAEVTDEAGTLYRSIEGSGELVSTYSDNAADWVYMPAGNYTATYYLILNGKSTKTGSRSFTVPTPELTVTASGYTSYTKYLEGDVNGANACNAYTVYSPVVNANIAKSLWDNAKYAKSLSVTLAGQEINDATMTSSNEGITLSFADQGGQTPSLSGCELIGTLSFDNTDFIGQKVLYITGLPASWTPPTEGDWSVSGTHDWNGNYDGKACVRLGQNSTSQPQYIVSYKFAVPAGVGVEAAYDVMMHGATVSTTLTLSFGSDTYFEETSSSGFLNSKDHNYTDKVTFTTTAPVTEAKANNRYGSGQTCSRIHSLSYRYN